jgi:hypothetical protein
VAVLEVEVLYLKEQLELGVLALLDKGLREEILTQAVLQPLAVAVQVKLALVLLVLLPTVEVAMVLLPQ